ncbi:hypothetical protein B0T10DRAFT_197230 [Thelonectria olida]|uniref:Mitochondrial division protein 1 n=1 Tax=Thelonectria olida TaxID=1576542 RepID=A0A9P9AJ19_9HYPO|nr:hypothetical protein B0T10DRAFT_197230 [Thelonectria olida]
MPPDSSKFRTMYSLVGALGWVHDVAFSPNGEMLAVILGTRSTIGIWKLVRMPTEHMGCFFQRRQTLQSISQYFDQIVFTTNRQLVTKDYSNALPSTWQLDHQDRFQPVQRHGNIPKSGSYTSFTLSQSGLVLIIMGRLSTKGQKSQDIDVWKCNSDGHFKNEQRLKNLKDHEYHGIACSSDGRWLVESSNRMWHNTWIRDLSGSRTRQCLLPAGIPSKSVTVAEFSPDSQRLVLGCGNETFLYENDDRGTWTIEKNLRSRSPILSVAFSSNSRITATGREDGRIDIWERDKDGSLTQWTLPREDRPRSPVDHLALSLNGLFLVSVQGSMVNIWENTQR